MKNLSHDLEVKEDWYEKLHDWKAALAAYEKNLHIDTQNENAKLGQMRCLQALGEWFV